MRALLVSLLVLLLAPWAGAASPFASVPPSPPSPEVQAILDALRAPEGKIVAWAAHHAGRLGVTEAGPPIARRLRFLAQLPPGNRPMPLVLTLLDTLARLRATPPPEAVMPYFDGWGGDPVLVILARDPHRYRDTLLQVFDDHAEGSFRRRVAGSVLASARVPGFAYHVLREHALELHLQLRDSHREPPRKPGSGYISGSFRDRKIVPPADWPSASGWFIGGWRRRGDEKIAEGPPALYVGRVKADAWHYDYGWVRWSRDDGDAAFAWSAPLLRTDKGAPHVWCRRHAGIIATGRQPYLRKLRQLRRELLAPYWTLVGRLLEDGALTHQEATKLRPGFRLVVEDLREGWAGQPLPTLRPPSNPHARRARTRAIAPGGV